MSSNYKKSILLMIIWTNKFFLKTRAKKIKIKNKRLSKQLYVEATQAVFKNCKNIHNMYFCFKICTSTWLT